MDTGGHVNQEQPHEDTGADMERSSQESTMKFQSRNAHQVLSSDFLEGLKETELCASCLSSMWSFCKAQGLSCDMRV